MGSVGHSQQPVIPEFTSTQAYRDLAIGFLAGPLTLADLVRHTAAILVSVSVTAVEYDFAPLAVPGSFTLANDKSVRMVLGPFLDKRYGFVLARVRSRRGRWHGPGGVLPFDFPLLAQCGYSLIRVTA